MSSFSGKTVLVTGATGLLGSHLVDAFMAQGAPCTVIALSRSAEKLQQCFDKYRGRDGFVCLAQDAARPLDAALPPIDYIFHAASPTAGSVTQSRPLEVIGPNLAATENLLQFLQRQKQEQNLSGRMVVFSSVTVYGGAGGQDRRVTEADTDVADRLDAPNAPYSQSKRMAEVLARAYWRQYGVDVVIGRFSTVYGYSACQTRNAYREFLQKAKDGETIRINSADLPRRDNIYVTDAIDGILQVCLKGEAGEAYNISSNAEKGNYLAVDEIARVIMEQAGLPETALRAQPPAKHLPGVILDNRKLKALGWELHTDFSAGVRASLQAMEGKA